MLKIRLMRIGKKDQPNYRVVVADARSPRNGKIIEIIGNYPISQKKPPVINLERYNYWISKGAQPTERVLSLFKIIKKERGDK